MCDVPAPYILFKCDIILSREQSQKKKSIFSHQNSKTLNVQASYLTNVPQKTSIMGSLTQPRARWDKRMTSQSLFPVRRPQQIYGIYKRSGEEGSERVRWNDRAGERWRGGGQREMRIRGGQAEDWKRRRKGDRRDGMRMYEIRTIEPRRNETGWDGRSEVDWPTLFFYIYILSCV